MTSIRNLTKPVLIVSLIWALTYQKAHAQLDPIYAQYFNNPLTINPAFTGSNKMLNANLQYRLQWAGLESNPTTTNFNAHLSLLNNRIGAGLMVIDDKLGDTKNTEFNALFAYHIALQNAAFSFGMQTGFVRYTSDPSELTFRDPGDPSFPVISDTQFNTGVGIMLKGDRYMLGLSVPRLLPVSIDQGGYPIDLYTQTGYFFGSYVMLLSETLRFKPSALIRYTADVPLSYDLNASLGIKENITAGIFTRNFKAYGLIAQAVIRNIRFGYVFELPTGSESSLNFTSHEFVLGVSTGIFSWHDKVLKAY